VLSDQRNRKYKLNFREVHILILFFYYIALSTNIVYNSLVISEKFGTELGRSATSVVWEREQN